MLVLGGSDQVEREVADDGHALGARALAKLGLVVAEGPVPNNRDTSRHFGSGERGDAGAHGERLDGAASTV